MARTYPKCQKKNVYRPESSLALLVPCLEWKKELPCLAPAVSCRLDQDSDWQLASLPALKSMYLTEHQTEPSSGNR